MDEQIYEVHEIFGLGTAGGDDSAGSEHGDECVICMVAPKDTAVLPCRHMCMCSECAKVLRLVREECPICRTKCGLPVNDCLHPSVLCPSVL